MNHDQLASEAIAALLSFDRDSSGIRHIDIQPSGVDTACVRVLVRNLPELLSWGDQLDGEVVVSVLRRDHPYAYVSVNVHGHPAGVSVTLWALFWTYAEASQLAPLWRAIGYELADNSGAEISLDALRAANEESTSDCESETA